MLSEYAMSIASVKELFRIETSRRVQTNDWIFKEWQFLRFSDSDI